MLRSFLNLLVQVACFIAIWLLADWLVRRVSLPIPAGVIGLALILCLLLAGVLPSQRLKAGADWLLGHMLLFFIPPLLAVSEFGSLLAAEGVRLFLALLLGCLIVMAGTGLVVDIVFRFEQRRHARREGSGHE